MQREFIINVSFLLLVNLLFKPFYLFFIETSVQNKLGPETYGLYFSIFNLSYLFYIILDLGIQNYGTRYLTQNKEKAQTYLSHSLGIKAGLSLVFFIVLSIAGITIGYTKAYFPFLLIIGVNQLLISFLLFFQAIISAAGHYRWTSFLSITDKLLMIVFLGILLYTDPLSDSFTMYSFILSRSLSFLLAGLAGAFLLMRLGLQLKIEFKWAVTKRILRQSLPYALIVLFMSLYTRIDGIMLERMLDDRGLQAGRYAASFRIFTALNILGYLFTLILFPLFSLLYKKNKKDLSKLVNTSSGILFSLAVIGALFFSINHTQIMSLLYPDDWVLYGTEILDLLMVSFVLVCLIQIFGTLITASGRLFLVNLAFVGGVVLNLTLNLILIPRKGAEGAALATIWTQAFILTAQIVISKRLLNITLDKPTVFKMTAFAALASLVFYSFNHYLTGTHWIWVSVVSLILVLTLAMAMNLLDLRVLLTTTEKTLKRKYGNGK